MATPQDPIYKKNRGQYFTTSEELQQFIFDKVKYKRAHLLEPAFGAGHLLKKFQAFDANYPMTCYEIDSKIPQAIPFNERQRIIYGDFTKQTIPQRFKTIIGNPPFVKQSKGNLYLQFIEQCYNLLESDGELIFIVPSDFLKLTSASVLIDTMTKNGAFTDFLFPHNERLFEGANIDIVVFRYEKGNTTKRSLVNTKDMFCNVHNGIITFSDHEVVGAPLSDTFDIYVGLVSGREEIYRVPFGNITILNDKGKVENYIFTETFPTKNKAINDHLLKYKPALLKREIRAFTDENWFEWGAPRNKTKIEANMGKQCLYIRNMTRNKEVAFMDTVQYFGGGLICLIPKSPMPEANLHKIIALLNSETFQKDYVYAGRFKIGQKQVSNIILPN